MDSYIQVETTLVNLDTENFVKHLVNLISQSEDFSQLQELHKELLVELGIVPKSFCSIKLTMVDMLLQKHGSKNALEYILKDWIKIHGESASPRTLATAFNNIGLPRTALYVPYVNTQTRSTNNTKKATELKQNKHSDVDEDTCMSIGQLKINHEEPDEETEYFFHQPERPNSSQKRKYSEKTKERSNKGFLGKFLKMIFWTLLTTHFLHEIISEGLYSTNTTLILKTLHDLNDQFQSGMTKVLLAVQLEEYNSSSHIDLHVSSYIEFQKKMHQYSRNTGTFTVFIHLKATDSWPLDVSVEDSRKITNLIFKGNITRELVISILHETINVKELKLANTENGLCKSWDEDHSDGLRETEIVSLKKLRSIYFENFHTCTSVYDTFVNYIIADHLQDIYIVNGTVNDNNKANIQQFIHKSSRSLKSIYLNSTSLQSNIFDDNMPTLPNVIRFTVDFLTDIYKTTSLFGNICSDIFPFLQEFISEAGHIPFTSFSRLLDCKNLTSLTTGVNIGAGKSRVNLDFMRNANSKLKYVNIAFNFLNKTFNDICEIEGHDEARKRFPDFKIQTNCNKHIIY